MITVMPTTILADEEGEEFDFLKFLRPSEPDKWMAQNEQTGEPEDFLLHWAHNDTELQVPPYLLRLSRLYIISYLSDK
jgi:hypothetical protein